MKELALIACLLLSGCETLSGLAARVSTEPAGSYAVPELSDEEAGKIARNMVGLLANQFPYAKTTIRLDPVKSGFHDALVHALAQQGFGVVQNQRVADAVLVHYAVTTFDAGVVVRMRFQGKEATRFCSRTATGLNCNTAYAMREAIK